MKQSPTDEEIIADMVALYHELGYLTYSAFRTYTIYGEQLPLRRFGSWDNACQIANIPKTRKSKRLIPMKLTWCVVCDIDFERPEDDPSCRRCPRCDRNQKAWGREVEEDWAKVAG